MDWSWVLLAILCYLFGSFPSAFIFVELKLHKDIRSCGSGNVGALNSYEVTGSKWIGLLVLGVDFLKGILAVLLAAAMIGDEELAKMLATLFVVIGHNYPVWLKFKGGRGLATIAGATLFFLPVLPLTWIGIWLLLRIYTSSVHFCNVFASVLVMFIATILSFFSPEMGYYFAFLLCSLILLSHKNVLRAAYLRQ